MECQIGAKWRRIWFAGVAAFGCRRGFQDALPELTAHAQSVPALRTPGIGGSSR